jgi:uncharacterized protein (TIGR02996 family)
VDSQAAPRFHPRMPRYEYSQGTSNKFWEIALAGTAFTTTFGKLGSTGQTKVKRFESAAAARAAHDKLVAEKLGKGYRLVGGAPEARGRVAAPAAVDARNPALEAAIARDPHDRDAFAIFGDWLQEQGDPRGELISLQQAGKDKAANKLLAQHADYFLGPLAEHQVVHDEGYNNSRSHLRTPAQEKEWKKTHKQAFVWRNGFIYRVRLSHDCYSDEEWHGETVDILDAVLRHPSGRYVVELAFQSNGDPNEDDLQSLIDLLAKRAPPTVRKLTFGDNVDQISWHHTGNLGRLWKAVPNLEILEIETGEFEVGKLTAPALQRAIFITGGLSTTCGKGIATGHMPSIRHLEIYYGDDNYGGRCSIKEARPLLDRSDLVHLEYLGLKNSQFANELAGALAGAKVVKRLKTLDLSLGTLTDDGARALADARSSLRHLEVLDLRRNFLTQDGIDAVKGLCKKVLVDDQNKPWNFDGELHYYVAVAE